MVSFLAPLVADLRAVCTVCNPSSGASGHLHHRVRYGHDQAVYLKPLDLDPYYKRIHSAGERRTDSKPRHHDLHICTTTEMRRPITTY